MNKEELLKSVFDRIIHHATLNHPLPWRIELDWTVEVFDANNKMVCKFMTTEEADCFIKLASDSAEQDKEADREFEEVLKMLKNGS